MRTTILLDDELAESFRRRAREKKQSLSAFLAEAGREALKSKVSTDDVSFNLVTFGTQGVQAGVNLDRTGEWIASEDERTFRG